MNSKQWHDKVNTVYSAKGKGVSSTAIKCLRKIAYAELYPTTSNLKIAESAVKQLTDILADVESGKPAKMLTHLSGEKVLTDETIKNRAVRFYEANVELQRIRESLEKRTKELESKRNEIESEIPHAQTNEFKNAVREVAGLFGTVSIPDNVAVE